MTFEKRGGNYIEDGNGMVKLKQILIVALQFGISILRLYEIIK